MTRLSVTLDGFAVDIKTKVALKKSFLDLIVDQIHHLLSQSPTNSHTLYRRLTPEDTDYRRIDETTLTTALVLLVPQQQVLHFPFWFTHYWDVHSLCLLGVSAFRQENSFINRITGGGFASSEQATHFTAKLATQQKINHRVLGKQMLLFTTDPSIGQGMIV